MRCCCPSSALERARAQQLAWRIYGLRKELLRSIELQFTRIFPPELLSAHWLKISLYNKKQCTRLLIDAIADSPMSSLYKESYAHLRRREDYHGILSKEAFFLPAKEMHRGTAPNCK
jgi:hypothetical protein